MTEQSATEQTEKDELKKAARKEVQKLRDAYKKRVYKHQSTMKILESQDGASMSVYKKVFNAIPVVKNGRRSD